MWDANYIDIETGDKAVIIHINGDDDLGMWYDKQESGILTISKISEQKELVWLEGCPYAVPACNVLKIELEKTA